jgi:hypothetical protein
VLFGYARTGVADGHPYFAPLRAGLDTHHHLTAGRCVPQRVVEQVTEDLGDPVRVYLCLRQVFDGLNIEPDAFLLRPRGETGDAGPYQRGQIRKHLP